jgi:hypothetical protein
MGRSAWAVATVLVIAIAWMAWDMRPSEATRIARRLDRLAAESTAAPRESEVDRLARAARLSSYLTSDARLELGESIPPVDGREAIIALATRTLAGTSPSRLSVVDVGVSVAKDGTTARATMTAKLVTRDAEAGADVVDAREVETDWVKQDGEWRIIRAALVGTLRR